ncbi:MAG: hypothetical protein R3195_15495 [Gemmatimonadota bacterium]|nr:hypothetical protein [Gemmatimonadota bacterium]
MRRGRARSFAMAASFMLLAPVALLGQGIYFGAGATFPTGDFGDYADTGWMGVAGVTFDIGTGGLWVGGEGFYGQNNHSDDLAPTPTEEAGAKTNPYGAMGIVGYGTGDGESLGFYFFGGAGLLVHKYSSDVSDSVSDSNFGYQAGAGVSFPLGGSLDLWGEGRFMGASDTTFFGLLAGLSIGLGN